MSSSQTFFERFFPTPRFMTMPSAGLGISDEAVRAITLVSSRKGFRVGTFGERRLPPGTIEAGYLKDPQGLSVVLSELKKELKLQFVNAMLPEEKAYLFRTELPRLEPYEIRQSLEFKIQENVPLSPASVVFDYSLIENTNASGASSLDAAVAVLPSKVVSAYRDAILNAGLTPVSFYTESQAIARAVVTEGDPITSLVVHMLEAKTIFFIVSRGVVQFASAVPVGGNNLTALIQKYFKVDKTEALAIKSQKTLLDHKDNSELFYSLVSELSVIKDEITKLANYWRTHAAEKDGSIERIMLSGQDAVLSGLDRYLASSASGRVEIANVWSNVSSFDTYVPPIPASEALDYAGPIGLALFA